MSGMGEAQGGGTFDAPNLLACSSLIFSLFGSIVRASSGQAIQDDEKVGWPAYGAL